MIILVALFSILVMLLILQNRYLSKALKLSEKNREIFKNYYSVYNLWMAGKNRDKAVSRILRDEGISKVGIYGLGEIGERLFEEFNRGNEIEVKCIIDQGQFLKDNFHGVRIISIDELHDQDLDSIIITPFYAKETISSQLADKVLPEVKIIAFDDLIYKFW